MRSRGNYSSSLLLVKVFASCSKAGWLLHWHCKGILLLRQAGSQAQVSTNKSESVIIDEWLAVDLQSRLSICLPKSVLYGNSLFACKVNRPIRSSTFFSFFFLLLLLLQLVSRRVVSCGQMSNKVSAPWVIIQSLAERDLYFTESEKLLASGALWLSNRRRRSYWMQAQRSPETGCMANGKVHNLRIVQIKSTLYWFRGTERPASQPASKRWRLTSPCPNVIHVQLMNELLLLMRRDRGSGDRR